MLLFGVLPGVFPREETLLPPPIALGLTLCDYVIVEERTKKVSLVGSFTGIAVSEFPAVPNPFSVFAVLTNGLGDVNVNLVVTQLDTDAEVYVDQMPVHFPDKLAEINLHFRMRRCEFPDAGWYQFTLLADGQWVAQRRVNVYQV
jgi:hypothetical protein